MTTIAEAAVGRSRAGYILIFERSRTGYSVYAPDIPGCISSGRTRGQTAQRMEEALMGHLRGIRADGLRVQRPRSRAELRRKGHFLPFNSPLRLTKKETQ